MYKNLVEIMKRKGITNKVYANYLGITEKTLWNKMDYVFAMEEKVA